MEIHKQIAYVPGDVNLWPNLTGGEVIDLFIKLRGTNRKNYREELIRKFDLDPTKKCRTYSKGNRQKVALVAALSSEADLYILDEPTSGLDPLMERVFQQEITRLRDLGKTVFLSSHILSEVEKLCDKVSIIRQGEIIETGTLDELRHLTRTHVAVKTRREIEGLSELKGVHDLEQEEGQWVFQVDSEEMGNVMKHIVPYDIVKLHSTPPALEDLFIRHYEGEKGVE